MAKTGRIQYLHDETTHAELILCEHSSISYPTHSHVSVLTAGMVLEGGIILTDSALPGRGGLWNPAVHAPQHPGRWAVYPPEPVHPKPGIAAIRNRPCAAAP